MKQQIGKLIDELADKTLSFGCRLRVTELGRLDAAAKLDPFYKDAYYPDLIYVKDFNDWDDDKEGISFLTENTLDTGSAAKDLIESGMYRILGHPIRIGDVLERIIADDTGTVDGWNVEDACHLELLHKWQACGFTKSLQEIYEETEWGLACVRCIEEKTNDSIDQECWVYHRKQADSHDWVEDFPKQKARRELFQFLLNLNLTK